jgi:hypothetical protein
MWFERLTGFKENIDDIRKNIIIEGNKMTSKVNGETYQFGKLEIPTLRELRERVETLDYPIDGDKISVKEVLGDVQALHASNPNATFQAASQFNLLEMAYPQLTPENGIDIYESDYTQGPACAIVCGAGTLYRNYFVEVNGQIGQTRDNQVDCLSEIAEDLGNLWEMENGYCFVSAENLLKINGILGSLSEENREALKSHLKVGIQWDTEITLPTREGRLNTFVTQIYSSALPVSYNVQNRLDINYWESFAKLILEATYESAFHTAILNMERTGNNKLFLTLVGGGAFGNHISWIVDSIEKVINKFSHVPLDVNIVSYSRSNPNVKNLERLTTSQSNI